MCSLGQTARFNVMNHQIILQHTLKTWSSLLKLCGDQVVVERVGVMLEGRQHSQVQLIGFIKSTLMIGWFQCGKERRMLGLNQEVQALFKHREAGKYVEKKG